MLTGEKDNPDGSGMSFEGQPIVVGEDTPLDKNERTTDIRNNLHTENSSKSGLVQSRRHNVSSIYATGRNVNEKPVVEPCWIKLQHEITETEMNTIKKYLKTFSNEDVVLTTLNDFRTYALLLALLNELGDDKFSYTRWASVSKMPTSLTSTSNSTSWAKTIMLTLGTRGKISGEQRIGLGLIERTRRHKGSGDKHIYFRRVGNWDGININQLFRMIKSMWDQKRNLEEWNTKVATAKGLTKVETGDSLLIDEIRTIAGQPIGAMPSDRKSKCVWLCLSILNQVTPNKDGVREILFSDLREELIKEDSKAANSRTSAYIKEFRFVFGKDGVIKLVSTESAGPTVSLVSNPLMNTMGINQWMHVYDYIRKNGETDEILELLARLEAGEEFKAIHAPDSTQEHEIDEQEINSKKPSTLTEDEADPLKGIDPFSAMTSAIQEIAKKLPEGSTIEIKIDGLWANKQ